MLRLKHLLSGKISMACICCLLCVLTWKGLLADKMLSVQKMGEVGIEVFERRLYRLTFADARKYKIKFTRGKMVSTFAITLPFESGETDPEYGGPSRGVLSFDSVENGSYVFSAWLEQFDLHRVVYTFRFSYDKAGDIALSDIASYSRHGGAYAWEYICNCKSWIRDINRRHEWYYAEANHGECDCLSRTESVSGYATGGHILESGSNEDNCNVLRVYRMGDTSKHWTVIFPGGIEQLTSWDNLVVMWRREGPTGTPQVIYDNNGKSFFSYDGTNWWLDSTQIINCYNESLQGTRIHNRIINSGDTVKMEKIPKPIDV
jgi:hypothetical protein